MKLSAILKRDHKDKKFHDLRGLDPLDSAVTQILKKYGIEPVDWQASELIDRLEDFKRRLIENNWQKYPWHRASELFRAFFTSDCLEDPKWSVVSQTFLDTLAITDRKSLCRAAIEVYFHTYGQRSPQLLRLKEVLATKPVEEILLSARLVDDLQLFDTNRAHSLIAEDMMRNDKPYDVVKSWGVSSPHSKGLFEQAFADFLKLSQNDLAQYDELSYDRIMNWLRPDANSVPYASIGAGIDAIVMPLETETDLQLRDKVEKFLISAFGDPRVEKGSWASVPQRALRVVTKWLTSKSLKVFFDVISKYEGSHMWEPRKRFWMDLDERDWVDAAWVILNDDASAHAEGLAKEHDDKSFTSHGRCAFNAGEKCFFILKVGRVTIIEGTHDFAVRLFDQDAPRVPDLNRATYSREQIYEFPPVSAGQKVRHDPAQHWTQKVEMHLRLNR